MTTIANTTDAPITTYVSSRWEIIDNYGYVMDEVAVESDSNMAERDVEQIALEQFANEQRSAYEPGDYKAEVVIASISHARRI